MQAEIQIKFNEVEYALKILKKHIGWESSITELNKFNLLIEEPNFWNDAYNAQLIMRDKKKLRKNVRYSKIYRN
jgi:peptide chain release factor 2